MFNKFFNKYVKSCTNEYLELANVYKSNSSKKKTDLIEMIVYGHMNVEISKSEVKDISIDSAKKY